MSEPTTLGFFTILPIAKAKGLFDPAKYGITNPGTLLNPLTDET